MSTYRYKTIDRFYSELYKEKASKFFALVYPVSTEDEVKELLVKIRKEYYDSRHVCYAYILGYNKELWRVNDAGEPSNTAGKPIYGQLVSFDLTNVLLVVVRYFGGTKLGVGGLIQAYKTSAQLVLEKATIIEKDILIKYKLTVSYEHYSGIIKSIKNVDGIMISSEQLEECTIDCEIPMSNKTKFDALIHLKTKTIANE